MAYSSTSGALTVSLPQPKVDWAYSGVGKGDLKWHPFLRAERQAEFQRAALLVAGHWVDKLLDDQLKQLDRTVQIPEVHCYADVDLGNPVEVAERVGRGIAGRILQMVYADVHGPEAFNNRAHWPGLARRPDLDQLLGQRIQQTNELLTEARLQWNRQPPPAALHQYVSGRGAEIKRIAPTVFHALRADGALSCDPTLLGHELQAAFKLPDDQVLDHLQQRTAELYASASKADQALGAGLGAFLKGVRTFVEPGLRTLEEQVIKDLAASMVRERSGRTFPKVLVPASAPALPEYALPKKRRKLAEQGAFAQAVARVQADVAHARTLPSPTDQYHHLEQQQLLLSRSGDAADVIASRLLAEYLHEQKRRWAREHMRWLINHGREGAAEQVSWSMPDMVRVIEGDVPRKLDPATIGGGAAPERTLLPMTKVNKLIAVVQEAWKRLTARIEPEVLNQVPPCYVVFSAEHHRAYHTINHSQRQGYMVLGADTLKHDPVATIMHEFGHHLEAFLPTEVWFRAQRLIEERSGGAELVAIHHPTHWEVGQRAEVGTKSSRYATRYYGGWQSATEFYSMGLENLSDPVQAFNLYVADPQQFAVLLETFLSGQTRTA